MRKSAILFTLLLCCCATFAQNSGKIKGTVRDNSGKPLQSASVSLLRSTDSALVKAVATSKDGLYEFDNIRAGEYVVAVTSVGFDKKLSAAFTVGANDVTVPVVQMNEAAKGMTGVTVTAKRPFIETRIDKTVVNVEASPTSAGATAMEVLEKSPGISVNNDGIISLRGKSGVIVLMDGKQTYLSPADLANLLKNMPASALDQIEIMTNPSSKYDAEGNSGVINIKTKKGRAGGFNGSLMTSWTLSSLIRTNDAFYVFPQTQNSFTFNYRKNKINFFGNYNPNFFRGGATLEISRTRLNQQLQPEGYNDVLTEFKFGNNNHTLKLGLDYQADKKNSFGVVVSGFTFSGHPTPRTTTTIADVNHVPSLIMESQTNNRNKFQNLTTNLNYRHQFDSTGRELTVDFDYITYNNTSRVLLTTDFFNGNGQPFGDQLLLKGYIPAHINIYSVKSDYVHPLKKGGRIEAGFKTSFVKNNNEVDYVRWDNVKWVQDARSNHFIYDENINAAYVNANKQFGKWSLQGGLRLENTNAKGYQVTNDSSFKRDFTNLFPSAFISREVNKNNTLTVSYSRRITRPNYQDLNPFIWFLDSLSYRKGNPFLMPQFTHNIELSHSFKGKLITTLNYNSTNDVISQILKPDGNIVYLTSDNVAKFRNMGVAVTLNTPLTKWWNLNLFTNLFNNYYEGTYEGKPIEFEYTTYMINMTQTFTVKKYSFEINGFYRAKGVDQLTINKPMYVLNFGGQKQIMNGKGTLRFNLRDPFWLQKYRGHTQYDVVDTRVQNKWDNRRLTLSFTWRFGKTNQQAPPPRRRNSASQDEQNRVGQGGQ
ncbi:MAG TPA: outer membrane beta-barrel protein [Chitinophagaceae bacterium]|jgi:outer membrane receptor protein involved in Fe transport|nr:outer membrane beta-barrel protein [Chitinophagaceae bacterium]